MIGLMKTGPRKVGAATCRVRQCNALPEAMRQKTREVASLEVPFAEQGKGYATTLMHAVCREADEANLVLVLTPCPFGDNTRLSTDELVAWYERDFGFSQIQKDPVTLLARLPGATPRTLELSAVNRAVRAYTT